MMQFLGACQRFLTSTTLAAVCVLAACSGGDYEQHVASGRAALAQRDAPSAIIHLRNALQAQPESAEARYLLGRAYWERGEFVAAAIELKKAASLGGAEDEVAPLLARVLLAQDLPNEVIQRFASTRLTAPDAEADLRTTLSAAYELAGDAEAAQDALKAAFTSVPNFPPAVVLRSRLEARRGNVERALEWLEQALKADPANAEAWRLKGDYLVALKAPTADAIAAYRQAIAVKPTEATAHSRIIDLLLAERDIDGAQAQADLLRKSLPGWPSTVRADVLLAYERKDFPRVRELSQQLLKMSPAHAQILHLAGAAEFELKAYPQAETHLAKALLADPTLANARRMLAQTYLVTGQPAKAVETIEPALQGKEVDAELLGLAGEAYLQNGDTLKAELAFQQAVRGNPDDARGPIVLALAKLARGDAKGLAELQAVAARDTGIDADLMLIRTHLRRRELDRALAAIDALERKRPDSAVAPNLRGMVLLVRNDAAAARRQFEQALAREPAFFSAAATLSTLDLAAGRPEQARQRFDAMLAADPTHLRALTAKAEVMERSGAAPAEVTALLGTAIAKHAGAIAPRMALFDYQLRRGDRSAALAAAQEGLAAHPESPELLDALGRVQLQGGQTQQAADTFRRLQQQLPKSPLPLQRLAEVQVTLKDLPAAESTLRRAVELAPDLVPARRRLVEVQLAQGKGDAALAAAAALQKQRPDLALGFMLQGDVLAAGRVWPAAAQAYRAGLDKTGGVELASRLHATLLAAGDAKPAAEFAAGWLKAHPADHAFLLHMGDQAALRGDLPQAQRRYEELLRLAPQHARALNNLAWVAERQKQPGALAYAEQAVALEPTNVAYLDTLASVLAGRGQAAKAAEVQRRAVESQPDNAALRLQLAKLYLAAGDKTQAREQLERLRQVSTPFPGQDEVEALARTL